MTWMIEKLHRQPLPSIHTILLYFSWWLKVMVLGTIQMSQTPWQVVHVKFWKTQTRLSFFVYMVHATLQQHIDAFFCLNRVNYFWIFMYQLKEKGKGALDTLFPLCSWFILHSIGDRSYHNHKYNIWIATPGAALLQRRCRARPFNGGTTQDQDQEQLDSGWSLFINNDNKNGSPGALTSNHQGFEKKATYFE